jgi:hypothetical protein
VIEFPTLADPKFRKASGTIFARLLNRLPLIGVSSLETADQTFLFSPRALDRILREHIGVFDRIELKTARPSGRAIAICRMRQGI